MGRGAQRWWRELRDLFGLHCRLTVTMMQYSQYETKAGDALLGCLARLAEHPSEEVVATVLTDATTIFGATRISLSETVSAPSAPKTPRSSGLRERENEPQDEARNELRIPIAGTSRHLVAAFEEPPSDTAISRLQMLTAGVSLALRLADRRREDDRARFHVTLGRAVAGVLHDISNPLNALLLSVESARDGIDVKDAVDDAVQSARLMRSTLDRLRSFTGGLDSRQSAIDVGGAIASALRVAAFETKGLAEVVVRVTPGLVVWARPGELEHVLVNLLINAAHALAGFGGFHHRITVSAFASHGDIIIEVHDTGPGIAAEHLGRLFDEGFTTKAARHGTGLGLSLCRDIITKLGGTIDVHAPRELGTRVTIHLPVAVGHGASPPAEEEIKPALPRVLIVDSDDLVARALGRALERYASVATAPSIARALMLIEAEPFDLIVCEHSPPQLDGIVLRQAQALRWPERGTQVFLTIINPYIELPTGTRVITKPIDLGGLKALVAEATPRRPSR